MHRRTFLKALLAGAGVAATLDPERLLWIPGEKKIFDLGGVRAATPEETFTYCNSISDQVFYRISSCTVAPPLGSFGDVALQPLLGVWRASPWLPKGWCSRLHILRHRVPVAL